MRGATRASAVGTARQHISIHAPHAGCDVTCMAKRRKMSRISIHAPHAGCDDLLPRGEIDRILFQSTHPMRGATTRFLRLCRVPLHFNPRTPCGVRPDSTRYSAAKLRISIHAPHAGCDRWFRRDRWSRQHFNPRTPCGVRQNND